jgi:hypothetical protein
MYNPGTLSNAMPAADRALFFALLLAHLAGDFVFQSDAMARRKNETPVLLKHAGIHAVLAYVIAGCWLLLIVPITVFFTHAAIDYVKVRMRGPAQTLFWLDQAAHGVVVVALTMIGAVADATSTWAGILGRAWPVYCVLLSGAILCIRVLAIIIGFWVQRYLDEIKTAAQDGFAAGASRGLTNGGRTIGQWERALIFLLVLVGQPSAIGFLIAAKSIFRFGELMDRKNRMEAEYITVGTLMSFGSAIAIVYGTLAVLKYV